MHILFIGNTICDSVFYALGKTEYMAYQSLLTNGIVFAAFLHIGNFWIPTFESILVVFSLSIFVE